MRWLCYVDVMGSKRVNRSRTGTHAQDVGSSLVTLTAHAGQIRLLIDLIKQAPSPDENSDVSPEVFCLQQLLAIKVAVFREALELVNGAVGRAGDREHVVKLRPFTRTLEEWAVRLNRYRNFLAHGRSSGKEAQEALADAGGLTHTGPLIFLGRVCLEVTSRLESTYSTELSQARVRLEVHEWDHSKISEAESRVAIRSFDDVDAAIGKLCAEVEAAAAVE